MSKLAKALTAAAGNAGGGALYVEDVFSTYLYEGNSSTQTITNGIDLDGEGGLVWLKIRPVATSHVLVDTERGASSAIFSDSTDSEQTGYPYVTSFNSDGFTLGNMSATNDSSYNYASWTFRKAEKFFDVVTYTGDGVAGKTVAHNLGSVPAVMIVKSTSAVGGWLVYHGSLGTTKRLFLDLANGEVAFDDWNGTAPTDSEFTLGSFGSNNASGVDFVAYLFASDAGGFGDDGSESIIKCGSYVGTGSATVPNHVELGFEPQYWLIKNTTLAADWFCIDTMRGAAYSGTARLFPNLSNAEVAAAINVVPTATGFDLYNNSDGHNKSGETYIYIAIRRPMKTPESGTEVFGLATKTGDGSARESTSLKGTDLYLSAFRDSNDYGATFDRLRGNKGLRTSTTASEINAGIYFDGEGGNVRWSGADWNNTGRPMIDYFFRRATGFFDVVAYTGNNVAGRTVPHNLGVAPELMLVKSRDLGQSWYIYNSAKPSFYLTLNANSESDAFNVWGGASTESVFQVNNVGSTVNDNGYNFIAYLFATLAGVSKVGSYTGTGTGSSINVDCGFSAGARFVLIKRTDSTGDWFVWDSVRGIVAGNDPYIFLNTSGGEATSTDYIDPLASGFTVTSTATSALNHSGGTYIFLAIA
jgi:hypothetical protein